MLVAVSFLSINAKNISKMYLQHQSERGNVVFVFEQKMDAADKNQGVKNIAYDLTYVEEPDSVSILSTIKLKQAEKPDKITITNGTEEYTSEPEVIFVNAKGKDTVYRLKVVVPFAFLCQIYAAPEAYKIIYTFSNGNRKKNYVFADKKWTKQKETMNALLDIIKLNTGR